MLLLLRGMYRRCTQLLEILEAQFGPTNIARRLADIRGATDDARSWRSPTDSTMVQRCRELTSIQLSCVSLHRDLLALAVELGSRVFCPAFTGDAAQVWCSVCGLRG